MPRVAPLSDPIQSTHFRRRRQFGRRCARRRERSLIPLFDRAIQFPLRQRRMPRISGGDSFERRSDHWPGDLQFDLARVIVDPARPADLLRPLQHFHQLVARIGPPHEVIHRQVARQRCPGDLFQQVFDRIRRRGANLRAPRLLPRQRQTGGTKQEDDRRDEFHQYVVVHRLSPRQTSGRGLPNQTPPGRHC